MTAASTKTSVGAVLGANPVLASSALSLLTTSATLEIRGRGLFKGGTIDFTVTDPVTGGGVAGLQGTIDSGSLTVV